MACAYRPEEVPLDQDGGRHSLAKVLREIKRQFGDVWVDLRETEKETSGKFVDALLDLDPNHLSEKFRAALFERTGGHPLFTVELLRSMREGGDLHRNLEGLWVEGSSMNWNQFPSRVEAVIEERIDRLDANLRELLSVASVEGEVFTAQVVARVARVGERYLLRKISQELERRHRLVLENQEIETRSRRMSRYRFGHVLYMEYLYTQLSPGERRLIHQEIAEALEELHAGELDEIDHREWEIYNRFYLAILYTELFALGQARKLLEEAFRQAVDLQSPHHIHLVSGVLAGTFLAMNELQKAQACLDRVLTPQTDTVARRYCWVRRAELAFAQDDPVLGLDITQRLISSTPANSSKEIITHLWQLRGEGLARTGRVEEGCVLLNLAIKNAHERREKYLLWRLYGAYGRICRAAQYTVEAKKAFAAAQAIIDELAATISDKDLKYDFQNGAAGVLQ